MRQTLLAAAIVLGSSGSAFPQTITWKEDVAGWFLAVDPSIDDGCFMTTVYEEGTVLRVQFNPSIDLFEFLIGDHDWQSIEAGKFYEIVVQFGSREPWFGEALGIRFGSGDLPTLSFVVGFEGGNAEAFIDEFMRMTYVTVDYQGSEIAALTLRGTHTAMQEVMACQQVMLDRNRQSDPFATAPTPSDDPFE